MNKIILKNGIFGGLIVASVMSGLIYFMKTNPDKEPNMLVGFGSMLAFIFVVVGILQYRKANNNSISFGKAFLIGFLISLVISVIYVVTWLIIYYNFFPDFMDKYSSMVLKNTKPEDLVAKTEELNKMKEWYKNPILVILLTLMEVFPFGIVISLLTASVVYFLKKK
ncbi:DUF4199 domain-containing protein [Flavobacterium sp. SUN052]|uniref:DUF4199 domain-containing protein n=1 Tax=Flavobacterium sp. SUN052 TaxID=3002441 RepID=UPI00237DC16C|nr:DUF4199 domain-containing protein [Flavobacterium sp. SUN052]MEC4003764.1 DUF4199 domain-containing protein [Flavobacterium sp. SUN052]